MLKKINFEDLENYKQIVADLPVAVAFFDTRMNCFFQNNMWKKEFITNDDELIKGITKELNNFGLKTLSKGSYSFKKGNIFYKLTGAKVILDWDALPVLSLQKDVKGVVIFQKTSQDELCVKEECRSVHSIPSFYFWDYVIGTDLFRIDEKFLRMHDKGSCLRLENIEDIIYFCDKDKWKNIIKNLNEGLGIIDEEIRLCREGKISWFRFYAEEVFNSQGNVVKLVGFFEDISNIKKAEGDRDELRDELLSFGYRVFHDLLSPLTSLEGIIEICKEDSENKESLIENLNEALEEIKRYKNVILGTLDVIEDSDISSSPVEINFYILREKIISDFDEIFSGKTKFNFRIIKESDFFGDEGVIYKIFNILISNSIRFKRKGRSLKIDIDVLCKKDKVIIQIRDNGTGFDKDENIFDMFQKGRGSEGNGLGLYSFKKIIRKVDGVFSYKTSEEGTYFEVKIPNLIT